MGRSRIEITVTGNHGCNRTAQVGEPLGKLCNNLNCVDCRRVTSPPVVTSAIASSGRDQKPASSTYTRSSGPQLDPDSLSERALRTFIDAWGPSVYPRVEVRGVTW